MCNERLPRLAMTDRSIFKPQVSGMGALFYLAKWVQLMPSGGV